MALVRGQVGTSSGCWRWTTWPLRAVGTPVALPDGLAAEVRLQREGRCLWWAGHRGQHVDVGEAAGCCAVSRAVPGRCVRLTVKAITSLKPCSLRTLGTLRPGGHSCWRTVVSLVLRRRHALSTGPSKLAWEQRAGPGDLQPVAGAGAAGWARAAASRVCRGRWDSVWPRLPGARDLLLTAGPWVHVAPRALEED